MKCCTKMKTGTKVSAFLPMIMTFLATQHWLHGLILFILLGGSASQMMSESMGHMIGLQRIMIVLTLITVLWSVYKLFKDGFKNKGMIVMTSISTVISVGYVIVTLVKTGW
jgi:cation transport ATPase